MRQNQYNSYLIRIWKDELKHAEWATLRWQGEVFHIQTGRLWRLHDLDLLSDLLEDLMSRNKPAEEEED